MWHRRLWKALLARILRPARQATTAVVALTPNVLAGGSAHEQGVDPCAALLSFGVCGCDRGHCGRPGCIAGAPGLCKCDVWRSAVTWGGRDVSAARMGGSLTLGAHSRPLGTSPARPGLSRTAFITSVVRRGAVMAVGCFRVRRRKAAAAVVNGAKGGAW